MILKGSPPALRWPRDVLLLLLLGAAAGCLHELLCLALPGQSPGVGGWAFLYRAIRGALALTIGVLTCLRLTTGRRHAAYGCAMGVFLPQFGHPSSAFGWPDLLGAGLLGVFSGGLVGVIGALAVQLGLFGTTKAKVSDPLDEAL